MSKEDEIKKIQWKIDQISLGNRKGSISSLLRLIKRIKGK